MNARSPLFLGSVFLLALLTGLGGGYVWYWQRLADGLQDGLGVWLAQRRAEGMVARADAMEISGFPFDIQARIPGLELGRGTREQPDYWRWAGRDIDLRIEPQAPWRAYVSTRAPQEGLFRDGQGELRSLQARADTANGTVEITREGQPAGMDAHIQGLTLSGTALTDSDMAGAIRIARLQGRAGFLNKTDFDIQGHGIQLPVRSNAVFGKRIEVFRIKAEITGRLPPVWSRPALTAWRDAGGTIDLKRTRLKWGDLDVTVTGQMAVDDQMRPLGSGTATIRGHNQSIRSLADRKLITPLNAAALTIGLNMLGQENNGAIKVPVSARGGQLKVGNISSLRLAPLRFPGE